MYLRPIVTIILLIALSFIYANESRAGLVLPISETDTNNFQLYSFFDLRDRESYIQVTNPGSNITVHFQVFDVGSNCTENNFFDTYTPSDTHVYNMRDIMTNNGNPSGVVLADNAYGFVVVTAVQGVGQSADTGASIIGNFRILDDSGFEYRTNSQGPSPLLTGNSQYTFNYNNNSNIVNADVVGIAVNNIQSGEVTAAGSTVTFNTTLFNNNEVQFSCSDTTFSCTADTFEYGINEAIPNSRDGGVVCGSNTIPEGIVRLRNISNNNIEAFAGYVGLNNGNGRGSMDSMWINEELEGETLTGCELNGFCRVFVTTTESTGNIGGLAGADGICQAAADSSMLTQGGTYFAWLSTTADPNIPNDQDISPNTRFNQSNFPYMNVSLNDPNDPDLNGPQIIANNYEELIDPALNLLNPIVSNENGSSNTTADRRVWTGTNPDGTANPLNCANWQSDAINLEGLFGDPFSFDNGWTDGTTLNDAEFACNNLHLLYCFEQ